MPFVSVTRLRLRSVRFVPAFFVHTMRTQRQLRDAAGFRAGALLPDARWTFWTLTLWDSAEAMRAYMTAGAHRKAMPKLAGWCDEASVVHWDQPDLALPDWPEAERRMRSEGRPSKLRHPSVAHASLAFAAPGQRTGVAIRPRGAAS